MTAYKELLIVAQHHLRHKIILNLKLHRSYFLVFKTPCLNLNLRRNHWALESKIDPIATCSDSAETFCFSIHLHDWLNLLNLLFLFDLVDLDLLINETAFHKEVLVCGEFDIKKLALVIKCDQNIRIFHRLVEIIKFGPIVLLLFFFIHLFLLLGYFLFCIFE